MSTTSRTTRTRVYRLTGVAATGWFRVFWFSVGIATLATLLDAAWWQTGLLGGSFFATLVLTEDIAAARRRRAAKAVTNVYVSGNVADHSVRWKSGGGVA